MEPELPGSRPAAEQAPQEAPETAIETPETAREHEPAPSESPEPAKEVQEPVPAPLPAAPAQPAPTPQEKDALRMRVERTLEDNLWKIYLSMPEGQRQQFKQGGEMCAETLRQLMEQRKVKPTQALNPITRWLNLIPNVLWAFLYQEAKIKTDKFMHMHDDYQKEKAGEIT